MLLRATIIWFLLAFLAILNGAVREAFITPVVGEPAAHVISTLIFCIVILAVAVISLGWIAPASRRDALVVGLVWVLLAFAFEFIAGHYLFGNSWEMLLADYHILQGRIWLLVPFTTLLAPLWAFRIRRL